MKSKRPSVYCISVDGEQLNDNERRVTKKERTTLLEAGIRPDTSSSSPVVVRGSPEQKTLVAGLVSLGMHVSTYVRTYVCTYV